MKKMSMLISAITCLLILSVGRVASADTKDAAQATALPSKPAPKFPLRMIQEDKDFSNYFEAGPKITYEIVGDLPPALKALNVKGMIWPSGPDGKLLPKPENIAGLVPTRLRQASDNKQFIFLPNGRKTRTGYAKQPLWTYGQRVNGWGFEGVIVVYRIFDQYDYAVIGEETLDIYTLISDLSRYAVLDDISVDGTQIAYTLASERMNENRWRAVNPVFLQAGGAAFSMRRTKANPDFDLDLHCLRFGTAICDQAKYRAQSAPDAAIAELKRYNARLRELTSLREEERLAQAAAERRRRTGEIQAILAGYDLIQVPNCSAYVQGLYLLDDPAARDWRRAYQIDQSIACDYMPDGLSEKVTRASSEYRQTNTASSPDYFKQFMDALDRVPTVLSCTKDYSTKTETCKWVQP